MNKMRRRGRRRGRSSIRERRSIELQKKNETIPNSWCLKSGAETRASKSRTPEKEKGNRKKFNTAYNENIDTKTTDYLV